MSTESVKDIILSVCVYASVCAVKNYKKKI